MAINKNFVVKNGIEVNTNLIVADTDSNKVGIGTTVPEYTLHVFQGTGIGASTVNVTGIGTFLEELNVGLAGTTLTVLSNDSIAGTGGSIGVGTALPAYVLDVRAPVSTGQTALYVQGDMRVTGDINIDDISIGDLNVSGISTFVGNVITSGITTLSSSGGITTTGGDFYVGGDLYVNEDIVLDTNLSILGIATIGTLNVSSTSGINTILSTVESSSKDTGALVIEGGVGIEKNLFVGGGAEVTGLTTITGVLDANNTTQSSSSTTGAATFAGGMGVAKNLFVGGGAEVTGLVTASAGLECSGAQMNVTANFVANSARVSDLTDNRVVIAGASGELEDDANLTFNGTTLATGVGATVGFGSTAFFTGSNKAVFGASEQLQISRDTNALISNSAGNLIIASNGVKIKNANSSKSYYEHSFDGEVKLFHDNNLKFETATGGVRVTGVTTTTQLQIGTQLAGQTSNLVGITTILDEDSFASNSAAALATQQSIKAYVDAQITAEDLDFQGDSGGAQSVDLDSQTFTIAGTTNEIETSSSGQTLTVGLPDDVTIGQDLTVTRNVSIADSIFHTGDTDTALRFPSADTITATTAGSERLRVTSTGLVGINTTPGTLLEIQGASGKEATVTFNREGVQGSNDGVIGEFLFENATDSVAQISVKRESAADDAYVQFATQATGGGLTERLRVDSSGRLLVGGGSTTTTCTALFQGRSDGATNSANLRLSKGSYTPGTTDSLGIISFGDKGIQPAAQIQVSRDSGTWSTNSRTPGAMLFFTAPDSASAASERLRITSAGKIGVNETSPDQLLHIKNNATAGFSAAIKLESSGTSNSANDTMGLIQFAHNDSNDAGVSASIVCRAEDTAGNTYLQFNNGNPSASTERLRIRSDGGIIATGIATFSTTSHLTVPVGTTAQRDSNVGNGMIRYNTTLNSYEGYGNGAWGGLGGGTEIDTSVSSTSATSITTFAHAEYRSAYFRVQIVQGSAYQVGRYLLIHDGTTVTVVEESAVATGDMLGTITAAIVSTNVVIYVNMGSSSSATITTIIDKITV